MIVETRNSMREKGFEPLPVVHGADPKSDSPLHIEALPLSAHCTGLHRVAPDNTGHVIAGVTGAGQGIARPRAVASVVKQRVGRATDKAGKLTRSLQYALRRAELAGVTVTVRCAACGGVFEDVLGDWNPCTHCGRGERGGA